MNVCVLGASGGLGSNISENLLENGCKLINCYRTKPGKSKIARKEKKNVEHRFIDTRTICKASEGLERIFRNAQVDCIVNAMGIGRSTYSPSNNMPIPTVDLSTREWEEIIFINLKFPILVTELALKYEIKKVIHIGSALTAKGIRGTAMAQAYSASKKAIYDYCEHMNEIAGEQLSIACLAPGLVRTKMSEGKGLEKIFESQLEPSTVSQWTLAMVEESSMPMTLLLPFVRDKA